MQNNPYSSPKSQPIDEQAEANVSRPVSVWLLLLLISILTLLFCLGLARFLGYVLSNFTALGGGLMLSYSIAWRLAIVAAALAGIVSAFKGRAYGRWVGVVAILGIAMLSIFSPDRTQYANDAGRLGGQIARFLLIPGLMAWWAYAYGFSAKSKRYFARRARPA